MEECNGELDLTAHRINEKHEKDRIGLNVIGKVRFLLIFVGYNVTKAKIRWKCLAFPPYFIKFAPN